ncbi:MAG: hypothetical protein QM757_39885 [Paludibaculum sp.]
MERQSAADYNQAAQQCGAHADAATKQLFEALVADEGPSDAPSIGSWKTSSALASAIWRSSRSAPHAKQSASGEVGFRIPSGVLLPTRVLLSTAGCPHPPLLPIVRAGSRILSDLARIPTAARFPR